MARVGIIIVNFNGERYLAECLESLERQTYRDFHVLLVDNASTDASRSIMEEFKQRGGLDVVVSRLDVNRGFAGGCAEGLRLAEEQGEQGGQGGQGGEFIALLNNDAAVEPGWLDCLVRAMDRHPEVGICASKILVQGKDIIDSAGDGFSSLLRGFKRGEGEPATAYNTEEYVFGACAGAALYRRRMIDEVGFLDADFFLIHEDTDLNLRARLQGWKVLYVPGALVSHRVRSTIGEMSDLAVYHSLRNAELVRVKNIPWPLLLRHAHNLALSAALEFFYFAVRHRRPGIYLKAKYDALRSLPATLKKRRTLMAGRKLGAKELNATFTPLYTREFFSSKLKKLMG